MGDRNRLLGRWAPWLLGSWFLIQSLMTVQRQWDAVGGDALLYYGASKAWLAGGNPWDVAVHSGGSFHFYALPPTVVLLAPFTLVPASWVQLVGVAIQAAAAVYLVRRLDLAWWWLLFPPIVSGVMSGNPSITLLAALLATHPAVKALAPILKVYAVLPLLGEGHWRVLLVAAGFTAATAILWPHLWGQFLTGMGAREAQLMRESNGGFSAYRYGLAINALVGAALLILAVFDRRAAGWLTPIGIWPASQFHWATLALPLREPWLAAVLAVHVQGLPVAAVLAYAVWRVARRGTL